MDSRWSGMASSVPHVTLDLQCTGGGGVVGMSIRERLVRQAHRPSGVAGSLVGILFGHRRSNVARNRWVTGLLAPAPGERVLELGSGPGVALAALAASGPDLVVGVDHSDVMVR